MATSDDDQPDLVTIQIPRSALIVVAGPPRFVHQGTVHDLLGLMPKTYVSLCKQGQWPAQRVRRQWIARYEDVAAYLEPLARQTRTPRPKAERPIDPLPAPGPDASAEEKAAFFASLPLPTVRPRRSPGTGKTGKAGGHRAA